MPTVRLSCAGDDAAVSVPATVTRPVRSASIACGTRPFVVIANVDLPDPLGPASSTTSPRPIASVTPRSAGSALSA